MSWLLFGVALNSLVSCADLLSEPVGLVVEDRAVNAMRFEQWPQYACSSLQEENAEIKIASIQESSSIKGHYDSNDLGVFQLGELRAGRVKLTWHNSNTKVSRSLWLRVKKIEKVWVFSRGINSGKIIKRRDLKQKKLDTAALEGIKDIVRQRPLGQSVVKKVRKGQVVTYDLVRSPPLIVGNEKIVIIAKKGPLTIEAQARALTTGWELGDTIQVKINNTDTSVEAIVAGEKEAHVEI